MIKKLLLLMGLVPLGTSMASAAFVNADQTITVGGEERVYKLYVPDSFANVDDPVLIFSLHGAGNSRDAGRPDFKDVADEKGCVVVYPQGLTQNFYLAGMNTTGWDATGESNKDLDFLKAIIEEVATNYTQSGKTLNRKRIYCCGFSNGGMMTYSNANSASDIFAAFASISGFPVNEFHLRHTGARPVPFLHIHGGADNFVNVEWYPTIRDIMVARNGCNPVPTTTEGTAKTSDGTSTTYTKYEYAASEGGFPYIYYNVAGMGHSDNCTIGGKSSSMVMYEFLTQYTLDSECDKTLKWKEQVDYSGYYPMNHGWDIVNSSTLSYGTAQAANNTDHNVYRDIQLEAGSYELRVKTSGTAGDKMTFKLETVSGTEVLNKEVTVGTDANLAFSTTAYAQYKLTFSKAATDDKITSVAIHTATAAGITLGAALTWDEVKDGNTPFILVQNGYALYKTGNDLLVAKPEEISSTDAYVFKVEAGTGDQAGSYFFQLYDTNETSVGYVNASVWSHAYLSGKNDKNGEYTNGLLWTVAAISGGGYSIRNLGVSQGNYDVNTDGTASTETKKSQGYLTANLNPNAYWKWHPQWTSSTASAWQFYSLEPIDPFKTITLAETQTTTLPVVLVKDDKVMNAPWGEWNDNGKMQSKEEFTEKAYRIKVEPVTIEGASNTYTVRLYEDGDYKRYLQASKWGHAFFNANYDNDGKNCAVWTISEMEDGKYSFRSLGVEQGVIRNNDGYLYSDSEGTLRINSTSPVGWEFNTYSTDNSAPLFDPIEAPRQDFVFEGYDANTGYTLRPIRQYGKDLVYADDVTHKVTLHGVMDTPNKYFNNDRWEISDWNNRYNNDQDVENCLGYFETLLSAFVNHEAGSYVDIFRLHLDPAWTNDPNKTATNGGGENDISRFSPDRLRTYMEKLYWPIAKKAIDKGMYVIMRPPGVCPKEIQVGGEYQNYLETVWDIVSKDENVKKYAGMIMIELANEPITVLDRDGVKSDSRTTVLHDFFQPIVDVIRANGFKGIILSSGSGYQWHYEGYKDHPITGDNIGYAVHWYPGWHGTNNSKTQIADQTIIDTFQSNVPVVESRPVVITEVDWSPQDESTIDHYNEFNQPVYKNYGTWATGYTSSFGKNFKATHDYFGNISMTLTHPYEYVDFDKLFNSGKVTYSFQSKSEYKEACAYTCFKEWYPALYEDHTPDGSSPKLDPSEEEEEEVVETSGIVDLDASLFHVWTGTLGDATVESNSGDGACVLNEATGLPYGHGSIVPTRYADLSSYGTLVITATDGEPRICFNRQPDDNNVVELEFPRDKESKPYETITDNGDGSKTYTIDLEAIVAEYGYAHLNAIKGANWANVTVTSMKLYPIDHCLKVSTPAASTNAWDWQIRYPLSKPLETNKKYKIEMTAKAVSEVTIQVVVADNDSENQDKWGGTADIQYMSATITTEWTTVPILDYFGNAETNGNYPYDYIYFNIGHVEGDLMISEIKITDLSTNKVVLLDNMDDTSKWTKTQGTLTTENVSSKTSATAGPNDINRNGVRSLSDLVYLIGMLNGDYDLNGTQDVNKDTKFNSEDVDTLVNQLLNKK